MSERNPYRDAGYNEAVFWGYVDGEKRQFVSREEYEEYLREREKEDEKSETDQIEE